jgi:hypothetical protein
MAVFPPPRRIAARHPAPPPPASNTARRVKSALAGPPLLGPLADLTRPAGRRPRPDRPRLDSERKEKGRRKKICGAHMGKMVILHVDLTSLAQNMDGMAHR